jgi:hypothetical protein
MQFVAILLLGLVGFSGARAEESPAEVAAPSPVPVPSTIPEVMKRKSPLIQKRGKRREQKETEGSEAPNRFEADTILKSPYVDGGQPLEVDPD